MKPARRRIAEKREQERLTYLEQSCSPFLGRKLSLPEAVERWRAYEQLLVDKYGESLDDAWESRDKAHRQPPATSPGQPPAAPSMRKA